MYFKKIIEKCDNNVRCTITSVDGNLFADGINLCTSISVIFIKIRQTFKIKIMCTKENHVLKSLYHFI